MTSDNMDKIEIKSYFYDTDDENCTDSEAKSEHETDLSENDSNNEENYIIPIKKRRYAQKYLKIWEKNKQFVGWLKPSAKGEHYAFCEVCRIDLSLTAGKKDIEKHALTERHKNLTKSHLKQETLTNMKKFTCAQNLEKQVSEAEIRLAGFLAEHNLAINIMEHMPQLLKSMFPDSDIAARINCSRTKATAILQNVTGLHAKEQLVEILRKNKFSIIIDESTDISCKKNLVVIARVAINFEIKDMFFDLIEVVACDAQTIYNHVIQLFTILNIPYKQNLIGFASDGANVMMGSHNSVASLLKKEVPNLFIMKCICHSFHLCASYACKKLPPAIEEMARDVYSYFSRSPKRTVELIEFQHFVNVKPHKLLYPSQTRWLSLETVIKRLLEQYDALNLYFTDIIFKQSNENEQFEKANLIYQKLNDPMNKLYLYFLEFALPFFTKLNRIMQAEHPQIHQLYDEIICIYSSILDCYIKREILNNTPITEIDHKDPRNFQKLEDMYFGAQVSAYTLKQNISRAKLERFQLDCLNFLIEGVGQIRLRFDFYNPIFQKLKCLDPKTVIKKEIKSIVPLALHFPNLITENLLQTLDNEWRTLRNNSIVIDTDLNVCEFWKLIYSHKLGSEPMYPLLTSFVFSILSLPHSSANCERIFSSINLSKTKIRNKLQNETICGLLRTKQLIGSKDCHNFQIDKNMLPKMKSDNLYRST